MHAVEDTFPLSWLLVTSWHPPPPIFGQSSSVKLQTAGSLCVCVFFYRFIEGANIFKLWYFLFLFSASPSGVNKTTNQPIKATVNAIQTGNQGQNGQSRKLEMLSWLHFQLVYAWEWICLRLPGKKSSPPFFFPDQVPTKNTWWNLPDTAAFSFMLRLLYFSCRFTFLCRQKPNNMIFSFLKLN